MSPRPHARWSLTRPPIDEVICGIVFEPIAAIDTLELGAYRDERKQVYPRKQLMPPLIEPGNVLLGPVPGRLWLLSEDDTLVVQVQHDRFYLNWRARAGEYPRFGTHGGKPGLAAKFVEELGHFREFLQRRIGAVLSPVRLEVAKVDILKQPRDWSDLDDLAALLPLVSRLRDIHFNATTGFTLRLVDQTAERSLVIQASTAANPGEAFSALRLEFQSSRGIEPTTDVPEALSALNHDLNDSFFNLLDPAQLERFGPVEAP